MAALQWRLCGDELLVEIIESDAIMRRYNEAIVDGKLRPMHPVCDYALTTTTTLKDLGPVAPSIFNLNLQAFQWRFKDCFS